MTPPSELSLASTDWIVLLVDASGSMLSIVGPTRQGIQLFVRQQHEKLGVNLNVVAFDSGLDGQLRLTTLLDTALVDPRQRALMPSRYQPDGDTPLLAAVWTTIDRLEKAVRPKDRVLLAIMTDGIENASGRDYTLTRVRTRIKQKVRQGWDIVYLGAELDAWRTGQDYGVGPLNTLSWSPTPAGVQGIFQTLAGSTRRWIGRKALASGGSPARFFPLQLPPPR